MRIKKTSETTPVQAQIVDGYSTSTTDGYSANYINNLNKYSTSEVKTNKVWIDDKPIYRKVIQTTSPSNTNTWTNIGNISNLSTLIKLQGFLIASDGRTMTVNHPEPSGEICTSYLNGNIQMKISLSNWSNRSCYIIVEYTKTT